MPLLARGNAAVGWRAVAGVVKDFVGLGDRETIPASARAYPPPTHTPHPLAGILKPHGKEERGSRHMGYVLEISCPSCGKLANHYVDPKKPLPQESLWSYTPPVDSGSSPDYCYSRQRIRTC